MSGECLNTSLKPTAAIRLTNHILHGDGNEAQRKIQTCSLSHIRKVAGAVSADWLASAG